jgi:hypothetical protein
MFPNAQKFLGPKRFEESQGGETDGDDENGAYLGAWAVLETSATSDMV